MQIDIRVTGIGNIQAQLESMRQRAEDTAPLMAELANHLYNVVDESFETQKTPDGISWSPIKERRSDPHPEKILYAQGHMQDSLAQHSSSDEAIVGLNATADGYPYPIVHQFGSVDGSIKARAFMPIHEDGTLYDETVAELEEIIEDFIKGD